jgi:hypothetical protein
MSNSTSTATSALSSGSFSAAFPGLSGSMMAGATVATSVILLSPINLTGQITVRLNPKIDLYRYKPNGSSDPFSRALIGGARSFVNGGPLSLRYIKGGGAGLHASRG